jgi:endonuclease/exonuclease/phosphatase family metal-dependent hydrolase
MTKRSLLLRCLSIFLLAVFAARTGYAGTSEPTNRLGVMTFNLRFASPKPPHSWAERRPVVVECIRLVAPDIIGTQEGLYQQVKDLAADLPEYTWIGIGREGGSRGEFMAVYYRPDRFEPIEFDHFWLSDTPDVIASTTWGNRVRRMVTWVRFLDRHGQREFYCINTHFDHETPLAREKSAALVRQRAQALKSDLPILLIGDFNAPAGSGKVFEILTADEFFVDTWTAAGERHNDGIGTFHNYKGPGEGARIDWILSRGAVMTDRTEIVTCQRDGQYPSDHFPVVAWMRWLD